MEYNNNIDERTKKILQTIIKHCNTMGCNRKNKTNCHTI